MSKNFFTIEEIKCHNKADDCWIICKNKVYDITKLMNSHPAGNKVLLNYSGTGNDCIIDYTYHSKSSQKKWRDYEIGYIKNSDKSNNVCSLLNLYLDL